MEPITVVCVAGLMFLSLIYLVVVQLARPRNHNSNGKALKSPPGPGGVPILGHIPAIRPPVFLHFTKLARQYGPVYQVQMGQMHFVILNTFSAFKEAFLEDGDNFAGRLQSEYINSTSKSGGILFVDGDKWREHRRFALRALRDLGFGKQTSEELIRFEVDELLQRLSAEEGQPVDTLDKLNRSVANVISSLILGDRPGYEEETFSRVLDDLHFLAHETSFISMAPVVFPVLTPILPLLTLLPGMNRARDITLKCQDYIAAKVEEKRRRMDENTEPKDFTEAYLREQFRLEREHKSGHTFTDFQLVRTVFELFIAGLDTSASTLSWGLLLVSIHPDIQRRIRDEIHQVLGKDTHPVLQHRKQLPYCCATLDEVFRFSSIAPLGVPHRNMQDATLQGFHIAKDSIIMPNLYAVHHDPQQWAKPDEFYPEHFLDLSDDSGHFHYRPRADLIPFNIGRRSCLGENLARAETFLFFVSILQRFQVALHEPEKHNTESLLLGTEGTIRVPEKHKLIFIRD